MARSASPLSPGMPARKSNQTRNAEIASPPPTRYPPHSARPMAVRARSLGQPFPGDRGAFTVMSWGVEEGHEIKDSTPASSPPNEGRRGQAEGELSTFLMSKPVFWLPLSP